MRQGMAGICAVALAVALAACGVAGKQSAAEGKLVDWNGKPVAGVKITAAQVQPINGYEQFEAVTGSDGSFRIRGLFPSSQYVLKPWSDKWACETEVRLDSAPQGETAMLPSPMVIARAFSKRNGALVIDLASGKMRFETSSDGVIADAQTGLEWVVGPDRNTDNLRANQWVVVCEVAGGGWRMPTSKELAGLYQRGVGERNMDPAFMTTGRGVWAERPDSSGVELFSFYDGKANPFTWGATYDPGCRAFAVRSR